MIIRHGRAVSQGKQGLFWGVSSPAVSCGGGRWRAALSVLANASPPPPKGEADLAFCKPLAGCLLGSPFGGRYVPVGRCPAADRGGSRDAGTALAVTERASRWPHRPALGKPLSRCATGRERRGEAPVSLAFSPALRAYKVKGKVETFLKKSFIKKLYARFARPPARTCSSGSHRRERSSPPLGAN